MQVDLTREDCELLKMLLSKAELVTRVEIHHAATFDFKNILRRREQHVHGLIEKIDRAFPAAA